MHYPQFLDTTREDRTFSQGNLGGLEAVKGIEQMVKACCRGLSLTSKGPEPLKWS